MDGRIFPFGVGFVVPTTLLLIPYLCVACQSRAHTDTNTQLHNKHRIEEYVRGKKSIPLLIPCQSITRSHTPALQQPQAWLPASQPASQPATVQHCLRQHLSTR